VKYTKALLLVAHPDDEAIFAGNLLFHHPDFDWHIACASDVSSERLVGWRRSIDCLRERGVQVTNAIQFGLTDVGSVPLIPEWSHALRMRLLGLLQDHDYDVIFTHNREGDYGHTQHAEVARIALSMADCPVWECVYPYAEHEQYRGENVRTYPPHDDKFLLLRNAYPAESDLIHAAQPALIDWAFAGRETWTSDERWPT
jgi:LmbE family N-acetylglucosaminyl deacetylase